MTVIEPRAVREHFVKNCAADLIKLSAAGSVVSDTRSLTGSFYLVGMRKDSHTKLPCQLETSVTKCVFSGRPVGHGKHRG